MARSTGSLSSALNQLSRASAARGKLSRSPTNVANQGGSYQATLRKLSPGINPGTKAQSFDGKNHLLGINFGKPPTSSSPSTSSGNGLSSFLTKTASGGLASALGGGLGLGSIGGIGSIISTLTSLFGGGGKKALPPLVDFKMPAAKSEAIYVDSPARYIGSAQGSNPGQLTPGAYSTPSPVPDSPVSGQWIQDHNAQIALAVKTALLSSSSLNDVIAEI